MPNLTKEQNLKGLKTVAIVFFVLAAVDVLLVLLQLLDSSTFANVDQSIANITIGIIVVFTAISVLMKLYIGMKGYSLANGKNVKVKGAVTLAKVLGVLAAISAILSLVTGNADIAQKIGDCASQAGAAWCYFYFAQRATQAINE